MLKLPVRLKVVALQAHAMRELAKRGLVEANEREQIVRALMAVVERPLAEMGETTRTGQKKLYILSAGPALESLAELHATEVVEPTLLVMYRYPALYAFCQRALIAAGPTAKSW